MTATDSTPTSGATPADGVEHEGIGPSRPSRPTSPSRPPQPVRRRQRLTAAARLSGLRVGFRALELVAPRAAGRRAFELWCTLPDNAGRRKDFRPGGGTVTRLEVPRGGTIAVESWGEGRAVYLVHGWGGWRGQLGALVQPFVDAGYRVVAFDAPSHGDSDPGVMGVGKGTLIELVEALQVVGRELGDAAAVVGHSMGCTASAMGIRASVPADRLVLIAPNHDFVEITRAFATMLRLSERTLGMLHRSVMDFVQRPISDFDLEPLGSDGGLPPTLVVHDRLDKETPYAVGHRLAQAWPGATLLSTEGLGHQRILTDAETIAQVVAHVTAHVDEARSTAP
ncbi:MAG: alpha/beta hydrolase [Actinotalea sp.]|nr:alpha/beta hydrolase [Actinotalea sp.]